jgi:uncharacterized protein (DUF697 family)
MQENPGSLNSDQKQTIEQQWSSLGDTAKKAFMSNFSPDSIIKELFSFDEAAQRVAKSFGVTKEFSRDIKFSLAEARKEVTLMGGTFEDIVKIQLDSNLALGRNVILQSDTIEKLFATTKVTGQNAKDLVTNFKDVGISASQVVSQMGKVVDTARGSGVNAQIVSAKVVSNLESLNRYNFQGGVDGLAKMAAQATGLRIDMKSTLDFAEKVFDPEGAIETAAALQRLGVTQSELLDPLRLLDLSQNDPAELQNQLVQMTKQFVRLNEAGNFEIAPGAKRQLREISKELGISYQELTKMALGSSELEVKLSKIKFPNTFTEEQKTMIANMAEMGTGGDYVLKVKGEDLKLDEAIQKLSSDETLLKDFMKAQEPIDMEQLAKGQLDTLSTISATLKSIEGRTGTAFATSDTGNLVLKFTENVTQKLSTGVDGILNEISGVNKDSKYSNLELSKTLDRSLGSVYNTVENIANGNLNLTDAFKKLTTSMEGFSSKLNIRKRLEDLQEGIVDARNNSVSNMGSRNTQVEDFIRLPGQTIQPLPQDTLFGGTGFENLMEKLGNQKTTTIQNTETKTTADINLNIKIDAPSQIDTNQLILAFNNQGLREKMIESMKEAMFNNGLTSPTSSKTKLMNPYVG